MNDPGALIEDVKWKLWLGGAGLLAAWLGLHWAEEIGGLTGINSLVLIGGFAVLLVVSVCWSIQSVYCPGCGLRLVLYAVSKQSVGKWLEWLWTVKRCPRCGFHR